MSASLSTIKLVPHSAVFAVFERLSHSNWICLLGGFRQYGPVERLLINSQRLVSDMLLSVNQVVYLAIPAESFILSFYQLGNTNLVIPTTTW